MENGNQRRKNMMKTRRIFVIGLTLLLCVVIGACNTIRGMGKDIEGAGQTIQSTAEKTRKAIP